MGEKMKGLRSTNWQLQNRHGVVKNKYRKWNCQRIYMHDPMALNKGQGITEGWSILGEGRQRGKNWNDCSGLIKK